MPWFRSGGRRLKGSNLLLRDFDKKVQKEIDAISHHTGLPLCPPPDAPTTEPVELYLNVYHLIDASSNTPLARTGLGLFHSAIEVLGIEWSFGEAEEGPDVSGLFGSLSCDSGLTLFRRVYLGVTTLTSAQVNWVLRGLEKEWPSGRYHILHCNCNHFSVAFARRLQTTHALTVPQWVNRIARVGDAVIPRRLATWAVERFEGKVAPTTADATVTPPSIGGVQFLSSGSGGTTEGVLVPSVSVEDVNVTFGVVDQEDSFSPHGNSQEMPRGGDSECVTIAATSTCTTPRVELIPNPLDAIHDARRMDGLRRDSVLSLDQTDTHRVMTSFGSSVSPIRDDTDVENITANSTTILYSCRSPTPPATPMKDSLSPRGGEEGEKAL